MTGPNSLLLWIVVGGFAAICLFIAGLLARVVFGRKAVVRPPAERVLPQTRRDLLWTVAPLLAFALVSVPLIRNLYWRDTAPAADVTITVTGRMWYWTYEYSNAGNFSFSAPMLSRTAGEELADSSSPPAYDHITIPVGKTVRIVAVGTNVIYSWAIPALGARIQAVPGWSNRSWFRATREGRYYGRCSELCGLPHSFKPVEVEVVSQPRFDSWAAGLRAKLAAATARQL
ncbi:MAG TPA: hypothetical protein VGI20_01895 [Rhizomicrobium sp.]|jgi:cytochrome c oxidase subunit 2